MKVKQNLQGIDRVYFSSSLFSLTVQRVQMIPNRHWVTACVVYFFWTPWGIITEFYRINPTEPIEMHFCSAA